MDLVLYNLDYTDKIKIDTNLKEQLEFNKMKEINFTNPAVSVAWYMLIGIEE